MLLQEAIDLKTPLIMDHPVGGLRTAAELFIRPDGKLVFVGVGWPFPGERAFHLINGNWSKVDGGPWKVGDVSIREILDGDVGAEGYNEWIDYRASDNQGKLMTRAAARRAAEQQGLLK
jgi:hypothetical protein